MAGSASRAASATIRLLMRKASGCTSSALALMPRSLSNAASISASLLAWTISIFSPSFCACIERIPHIPLGDRIARVDEKADQRRGGHQVAQKPDLLCRQSSKQRGHAGDVAAGAVQACDKAARDWILAGEENNRDVTSGALCSVRCRRVRSEDGNPATDKVVDHIRDAIIVALGPAVFDRDIFADRVAGFCKSADECLHICGVGRCR